MKSLGQGSVDAVEIVPFPRPRVAMDRAIVIASNIFNPSGMLRARSARTDGYLYSSYSKERFCLSRLIHFAQLQKHVEHVRLTAKNYASNCYI